MQSVIVPRKFLVNLSKSIFRGSRNFSVCTVFGATGAQGGSVARNLAQSRRFDELRLVSRDITKDAAKRVQAECAAKGVKATLVKGDLADIASVDNAIKGASHSFLVTNWWETFFALGAVPGKAGFAMGKKAGDIELAQGKAWVDACKKHKLEFVVFSGLENVSKLSGGKLVNVYHFDYKGQIEEYMWSELPGKAASARAGMYMDNFLQFLRPQPDGTLALPSGTEPLGLISIAEFGGVVDGMFKEGAGRWGGKALGTSGDNLTGNQIAATWSAAVGKTVKYWPCPMETFASFGFPGDAEMAEMFDFYRDQKACVRDPVETRRVSTSKVSTFAEWCAANKDKLAF